jgi:hypothetical protein
MGDSGGHIRRLQGNAIGPSGSCDLNFVSGLSGQTAYSVFGIVTDNFNIVNDNFKIERDNFSLVKDKFKIETDNFRIATDSFFRYLIKS